MNAKPVADLASYDINKHYLVYDRTEGWHRARPYPVRNYKGDFICLNWELPYNDDGGDLLVNVTHVAELPPNPLA
jgi:hypothetical protein